MSNNTSRHLHQTIESLTHNFDRSFDNTVVDTYAFDKALHSEALVEMLYNGLQPKNQPTASELDALKQQVGDFILYSVENIYHRTHHKIISPAVYQAYTDKMVTEIALALAS